MLGELPDYLEEDPGDPRFLEFCRELSEGGETARALALTIRGLSANPSFHQGRLFLAKLFFQLECVPFALREIDQLIEELPHVDSLRRLRERISPTSSSDNVERPETDETTSGGSSDAGSSLEGVDPFHGDETLAEADFDFDELDLMDEKE